MRYTFIISLSFQHLSSSFFSWSSVNSIWLRPREVVHRLRHISIPTFNGRYPSLPSNLVHTLVLTLFWSLTFLRTQRCLIPLLRCLRRLERLYQQSFSGSLFPLPTDQPVRTVSSHQTLDQPVCTVSSQQTMDKPSSHTSSNTMTALFPHPSFNGEPTVSSMAPSAPTSSSFTSLVSAPVESRVAPSFASLPLSSEVVSSVSSSFGLSPQSSHLLPLPIT